MRWFKHDSDAHTDAKLKKLRIRYGMEGYGLYWYCLELIARDVEETNINFELEHDAEIIAHDTGIHIDSVQEMMRFMVDKELFESGDNGTITCLKMAKRLDKSMTTNPAMRQLITNIKTVTTDYEGYVYFVVATNESLSKIKIGRSKNPWQRLKELARRDDCQGFNLSLAGKIHSEDCVSFEASLHRHFSAQLIENEWFSPSRELEQFIKASTSKEVGSYDDLLRHVVVRPDKTRLDKNRYKYSDEHFAFAEAMYKSILNVIPGERKPNFESWANTIRLTTEKDKIPLADLKRVFSWANSDEFWSMNIRSPSKLREQFALLDAKSKKTPGSNVVNPFAEMDALSKVPVGRR